MILLAAYLGHWVFHPVASYILLRISVFGRDLELLERGELKRKEKKKRFISIVARVRNTRF